MKHLTVFAAAIAAGALLAAPALADTEPPAVISVTGEATVSVAPDLAQIDGGVTSDAKTAREASDANNAAMGKVLLALKGAGIAEKDLQTSRLSLQPESAPNRSPPSPPGRRDAAGDGERILGDQAGRAVGLLPRPALRGVETSEARSERVGVRGCLHEYRR